MSECKSLEQHFADWEASAFGYGYGTGEPHTLPMLKAFLSACPDSGAYDHRILEEQLGAPVTWFLINVLCRANALEYGSSPRFAWLTKQGLALKTFVQQRSSDELVRIVVERTEDDVACYPDFCNCSPDGEPRLCPNPFWGRLPAPPPGAEG